MTVTQQNRRWAKLALASLVAISGPLIHLELQAKPRDVSHSTSVELRLNYLSNMLDSRSGQRLLQYDQGATYKEAVTLFNQARKALQGGDPGRADQLAKEGFSLIMAALKELPDDSEEIARLKNRFEKLRQSVTNLTYAQENAQENFANNEEGNETGRFDPDFVYRIIEDAKEDANRNDYEKAIAKLDEVYAMVTRSIKGMMNHRQVVIELDIGTPEKEYFYELRRFQGYQELIPVAIEVKKPSDTVAMMLRKAGEKADWMAEQARNKAIEGDYPVAIRMMMDATQEIKNSLKLVGIYM